MKIDDFNSRLRTKIHSSMQSGYVVGADGSQVDAKILYEVFSGSIHFSMVYESGETIETLLSSDFLYQLFELEDLMPGFQFDLGFYLFPSYRENEYRLNVIIFIECGADERFSLDENSVEAFHYYTKKLFVENKDLKNRLDLFEVSVPGKKRKM